MDLNLARYSEDKSDAMRRLVWRLVNLFVLPFTTWVFRRKIFGWFGMKQGIHCALYARAHYFAPWNIELGQFVCIGPGVELYSKDKIKIGNNVIVSQGAYLCTASHDISSRTMDLITKPITVGDNVWIAAKAIVLPGVTIGEGAVVGCGAVVAKNVEPWTVVAGNPARVVGRRRLLDE